MEYIVLFIVYSGNIIQKSNYLKRNFKGTEKEYKYKFIAIYVKKIIGLNRYINKLIKEPEQNSKNIPSVIIKLNLKIII